MFAVNLVKVAIVGGGVLRTVPPVPVTALGNQNFFKSELSLGFARVRRMLRIEFARMMKVVPSAVVFGSANPDIEVQIDPRAGNQRGQGQDVPMAVDRLRNCNGLQTSHALQRVIETPQKFPS